jgi:hypothetical protein
MNGVHEFESWSEYSKKLPLVAVVGLVNEWMTIYPCLQQAIKVFDKILVIGDDVSPKALEQYNKFIVDYKNECDGKIEFIELGNFDPWPWISLYDPKLDYKNTKNFPKKSANKADYKRLSLAKTLQGNSIICSLHSDIIVFDDIKNRIKKRIENIDNPLLDSEWFNLITLYDKKNAKTFLSNDSKPGNLIKDPNLNQRYVYDYPGDWGLMSFYGSSLLLPGPDPLYPFFPCMWPWSKKTQMQKKGQDNSATFAIHLEYIRDSGRNKSFDNDAWSFWQTEKFEKEEPELHDKLKVLNELNFPVDFWLDESNVLRIEEKNQK